MGTLTVINSTLSGNTAKEEGGAIDNSYILNVINSTLSDNTASWEGGAIRNSRHNFSVVGSNFTNNHARNGGAIFSSTGNANITGNTFSKNTADYNETLVLNWNKNGHVENNTYNSTDIRLNDLALMIKDNQTSFLPYEDVVLNFTISLTTPENYDNDILERLEDITIYVNGAEYATTKYENYTLSNLGPGDYTVYIKTCNQKSKSVTFRVIDESMIKVTTWDVEMVRGRGVTFSAFIKYENMTINQGEVYFEIDGKPILGRNGFIRYVPVKDNWADLPYEMTTYISIGNHTLTAVYVSDKNIKITDNKTLTIIENIPEGAGDKDIPSEDERRDTHKKDARPQKTIKYIKTMHSTLLTSHKVITDNNVISIGNTITLGKLNDIFGQTFTNGHLILYIDGKLVFNGTVGDDLSTVILEILEKFLARHEFKVEFTGADGKTNTYTKKCYNNLIIPHITLFLEEWSRITIVF